MSEVKHKEQDLREKIIHQTIDDKLIHYSLGKKDANTLSFLTNDRLLIFDETQGVIYYTNPPQSAPFKAIQKIPKAKTDQVKVTLSIIKQIPQTSTLSIQYNRKNNKNQNTGAEWKFTLSAGGLAAAWIKMIEGYKGAQIAKLLGVDRGSKLGVISDAIAFGYVGEGKKEQVRSQEEEMRKSHDKNDPVKNQANERDDGGNAFIIGSQFKKKQPDTKIHEGSKVNESQVKDSKLNENKPKEDINKSNQQMEKETNMKKSQAKEEEMNKNQSQEKLKTSMKKQQLKKSTANEIKKQQLKKSTANQMKKEQLKKSTTNEIKKEQLKKSTANEIKKQQVKKSPEKQAKKEGNLAESKITNERYKMENSRVDPIDHSNFYNLNSRTIVESKVPLTKENELRTSRLSKPIEPQNQGKLKNDWNYRFIVAQRERTQRKLIQQFNNFAVSALSKQINTRAQNQTIERDGLIIHMAEAYSPEAEILKNQFRNYHYLLECQDQIKLGVPLAVCVQYYGMISLIKTTFPSDAHEIVYSRSISEVLSEVDKLTFINHSAFKQKSVKYYDLTKTYGSIDDMSRIYVDQLQSYLPQNPFSHERSVLRPEYVLTSKPNQTEDEQKQGLEKRFKTLIQFISEEPFVPINYIDFKNLVHERGLNMNFLPEMYQQTKNKYIKKILHTFMLAKLIKKEIVIALIELRSENKLDKSEQVVQGLIKSYVEGGNLELWKSTAHEFKRKYNMIMNPHEICANLLLSSILYMVYGEYDITKLNKEKTLLEDRQIITPVFVRKLLPKVKYYDRFYDKTKLQDLLDLPPEEIQKEFKKKDIEAQFSYLSQENRQRVFSFLTNHISPSSAHAKKMYEYVNHEPPTKQTQNITNNYFKWLLRQSQVQLYKKQIESNLQILDYWVTEDHPFLCSLYQSLADYYEYKNQEENSINFAKQALTTYIRSGGTHTHEAGKRYENLGDRQLRAGFKKEAMENFQKSRANMEGFGKLPPQYSIVLMKIAGLHLNFGEIEECISKCLQSLKKAEDQKVPDYYLIRTYEMLGRAYELNGDYEELKDISILCCKVFNKSRDKFVFDQMIRLSVTGALCNLKSRKRQKLQKMLINSKKQRMYNSNEAIEELMMIANQYVVMEKFMKYLSMIERVEVQINRQSKIEIHEFERMLNLVVGAVGLEFFEGIMTQNEID